MTGLFPRQLVYLKLLKKLSKQIHLPEMVKLVLSFPICSSVKYNIQFKSVVGERQHFDEMVSFRKKEARSSVVIQVGNPSKSSTLLNKVCSRHGNVKNLFHYTYQNKVNSDLMNIISANLMF